MYVYSTDKMLNYVNKCNCASTIRKAVCIQSEEVWAEERRKCGGARGIEKDSQYCFPWNTSRNTNGASGPWFCPQMTQTTAVWTLSVLRHWPFIFPIKALKTNALKKKMNACHCKREVRVALRHRERGLSNREKRYQMGQELRRD